MNLISYLKVWSQKLQPNGLTSSCILICTTKLYDLAKVFPHTSPFSNTQLHVLLFPTVLCMGCWVVAGRGAATAPPGVTWGWALGALLLVGATLVTMGSVDAETVFVTAGMISTLVRFATVWTPAVLIVLMLMGRLLTAESGIAFRPLIWIGIAPWGRVFPKNKERLGDI